MGKRLDQCKFIIAHMGGGVTVGAHCEGMVIDVNNGLAGYGPMSLERAGTVHMPVILLKGVFQASTPKKKWKGCL